MTIARVWTTVVLGLASLLTTATAHAQSVGIRGGLTFATSVVEAPPDVLFLTEERVPRPLVGVFFGTDDRLPVGVQGEAFYEEIGARTVSFDLESRSSYLTLPALAKIRVVSDDAVRLHGLAGISVGVLLDSWFTDESDERIDNTDEVSSTNVGLVLGGSLSISRLVVDARYTWGLTNRVADSVIPGLESTTRVFAISAGVRFGP